MPVPAIPGIPPYPEFNDLVTAITKIRGELVNLLLNLDSLNVVSLTADHIDAGTINAGVVTIRVDYDTGAYVLLDDNGMTINDGTRDTFNADTTGFVTMTGALVQSDTGYPKVELNGPDNLIAAYASSTQYAALVTALFGTPALFMTDGTNTAAIQQVISVLGISSSGGIVFTLGAGRDAVFPSWGQIFSNGESQSLATALSTITSAASSAQSTANSAASAASSAQSTANSALSGLASKADTSYVDSNFGVNLTFDSGTRNLKMFAQDGTQIAIVNIP